MRFLPITDRMAQVVDMMHWTYGDVVPVGSLVVEPAEGAYLDSPKRWLSRKSVVYEVTQEDLNHPAFQAGSVKWVAHAPSDPGMAHIADGLAARKMSRVLNETDEPILLEPGDLVAMFLRTYDHQDWYIGFLESSKGVDGEPTLGFQIDPVTYGTLDIANQVFLVSAVKDR